MKITVFWEVKSLYNLAHILISEISDEYSPLLLLGFYFDLQDVSA
jgi:hypothetical protein